MRRIALLMAVLVLVSVLVVVGVGAVGCGLFILSSGEDHVLGVLGWSWRVGDISQGWAYALLIGGGLLLVVVFALGLLGRRRYGGRALGRAGTAGIPVEPPPPPPPPAS